MALFSKTQIDFTDTNSFSTLILDYLSSSKTIHNFQSYPFTEEGFKQAIISRKKTPVNRKLLSDIIRLQYKKLSDTISISDTLKKNISSLQHENTFTVTTGHQLNLFTGPLYFIYKIVTTINLARQLNQTFPEDNFIPLYWMASEDHDLDEINHINLFGKKIEWKSQSQGAAGRIMCTGISEVISLLREMLGTNSHSEKIINIFSKAYDEKNNLSEATRIVVHELFSEYGILILDADDASLKKLFVNEMKDDVVNHSAFKLVNETVEKLEKNYKVQVHPREMNLFYLGENFRERIVEEDGDFKVLNTEIKFSKEEILNQIENHPEQFSPNVVLRPLYQEKILPNIAYVGGPAEISYWHEYKKMFEHYSTNLPVLVLRNCVMIVDAATRDKLKKLGFEPEDLCMNENELIKKYLEQKCSEDFSISELSDKIDSLFSETINKVNEIDPTLKTSVEAEKQKTLNNLKTLEERILRAEKRKHETAITQIKKIKEKLFPEGKLQERHENLFTYYSKFGYGFLDELLRELNPMEKKFILLVEE